MRQHAARGTMVWLGHAGDHPFSRVLQVLATLGPVGYVPLAPGTAASLVAGLAWLAVPSDLRFWLATLLPLVAFVGIAAAGEVARCEAKTDPPEVVIDEAVGMWLTLALAPRGMLAAAAAFLAFRAFDVVKPFPVGRLERLAGGWGIVADDLAAALYAGAAVRLVWYILGLG